VIGVVIPTLSRSGESLEPLLEDLRRQTCPSRVYVVRDVRPSGRARNLGARQASEDVLVFLDDDVRLGHEGVLEAMVRCLAEAPCAGLVGASQLLPPESTWFQRAAARQIARSTSPVVAEPVESDMVTTACCAIRRETFWGLGGFREDIPRGVDPEFRARLRHSGLRTVVAPGAWFYHPMPASLGALWRTFFRNGAQTACAVRTAPWVALENPDGHVARFRASRSPAYRVGRHLLRFAARLVTFRWIGLAAQVAYVAGYATATCLPVSGDDP
jgi:GT2 family glycosyltransferase